MDYREQLLTEEWKEKRNEILKRDHFRCTLCGVKRSKFIGLVKDFGIKNFEEMKSDGYEIFDKADNRGDLFLIKKNFLSKVHFIDKEAASAKITELKFAIKYKEATNKLEFKRPQLVAFLEDPPSLEDIVDLNIHHKFYVENKLAWEYDNDALTVLCSKCHQQVHETEDIYCYLENGEKKLQKKCWKCLGSGFLPQFSYYQNGICFACGGSGIILET